VECQLNVLRKCFTVPAIRKALQELPATLEETYDRILNSIPKQYCREARIVMQLLAISYRPMTLSEVSEAVIVDYKNCEFDPENRLRDPHDLLEICSSLITVTSSQWRYIGNRFVL
jgi:hypothetical protein